MRFTRRRMLLGLGTTAAVTGGVLGTGAMTSVQADRTIDIDVAGDSNAFVGLYDTSSGDFVDKNDGALRIRLNDQVASGSGVNHGTGGSDVATTTLDPAFTLRNQGANTMYVQISHGGVTSSGNDVEFIGDDSASDSGTDEDSTTGDVIATTNNLAFMDRVDSSTDGLDNDAVTTSVHSGGTTTAIDEAGYLTLDPKERVDVVLQVASDSTTTGGIISTATIEAFDDSTASGLLSSGVTTA